MGWVSAGRQAPHLRYLLWDRIDDEANGLQLGSVGPRPPPVLLHQGHQAGADGFIVLYVVILLGETDLKLGVGPECVQVAPAAPCGAAPPPAALVEGGMPTALVVPGERVGYHVADFQEGEVAKEILVGHPELPVLLPVQQLPLDIWGHLLPLLGVVTPGSIPLNPAPGIPDSDQCFCPALVGDVLEAGH